MATRGKCEFCKVVWEWQGEAQLRRCCCPVCGAELRNASENCRLPKKIAERSRRPGLLVIPTAFRIDIVGRTGTGKTVAAGIIARALRDANFVVDLHDGGDPPVCPVKPGDLEETWRSRKGWGQRIEITVGEGA